MIRRDFANRRPAPGRSDDPSGTSGKFSGLAIASNAQRFKFETTFSKLVAAAFEPLQ
jgi:hypothetical protein